MPDQTQPYHEQIDHLVRQMSLAEKAAQLRSLPVELGELDEQGELAADVKSALREGIGVIGRPIMKLPPGEGARLANAVQRFLLEQTRLGIPALMHEEALHGLMAYQATVFPQAIGLGSTWNLDLVKRVYAAAAAEMRWRGSNLALTPDLDLGREPRWGRVEETFGEDPYLVSRMGVAAVEGLQGVIGQDAPVGEGHVLATAKHYAVHGQPEGGRNLAPGNFSRRIILEEFLPPFEAAVRAGVGAVMASYNEIDGIPSHINPWLLDDILRKEWGFAGMVLSDGGGIEMLHELHGVAESLPEAARQAVSSGVALELPGMQGAYQFLIEQVENGLLAEEVLDAAVRQVLRAKLRLGLFEQPFTDPGAAEQVNGCSAHRQLALEAARQSLVLLKNENNLLPLDRASVKTIAVIGPNAAAAHLGGYTYEPGETVSLMEGIQAAAGKGIQVLYAEGCRITESASDWRAWWLDEVIFNDPESNRLRIARAVEIARQTEVVVLVLGENEATGREAWSEQHLGDRDSLGLPGLQDELMEALHATGVPVVAALINGRPLAVSQLAERVPALIECWYPGQAGGTAFGEILFGDVNPSGKLPISVPRSVGQLPVYHYQKPSARRSYLGRPPGPLYAFGYGLSYTSFSYGELELSGGELAVEDELEVSVEVLNDGPRPGVEVVQLYVRDLYASVTRPVQELKGFARIELDPGESRTVKFTLKMHDLAFYAQDMQRRVEPGEFEVWIGVGRQSTARRLRVVEADRN